MHSSPNSDLSTLDRAILHTVLYADIFDYPLTAPEIHRYLTGLSASLETVESALPAPSASCRGDTCAALRSSQCRCGAQAARSGLAGVLRRLGDYYVLPGREGIISTRQRRQAIAARLWPHALHFGALIAGLPFVRMVAVTGSLAMDNVENNADLDYLIVTTPGRLWLCRALILALGRLAVFQGVRLCPNYIISQRALEFPAHNIYAAHELAQMVPISGMEVYDRIRVLNPWMEHFLPNAHGAPLRELAAASTSTLAPHSRKDTGMICVWCSAGVAPRPHGAAWLPPRLRAGGMALRPHGAAWLEALLLTPPGAWLEKWEMDRKIRRLRRENGDNPEASFSADLCKGHSHRHGQKTEQVLRQKLESVLIETIP